MVIVSSVLIIVNDQKRLAPQRRVAEGVNNISHNGLANNHVLWVFLGLGSTIQVDERKAWEISLGSIGEELVQWCAMSLTDSVVSWEETDCGLSVGPGSADISSGAQR